MAEEEKKPLEEIPKEEEETPPEPKKEEEKPELPKIEDEEPPTRFIPKKEDNRLGYQLRQIQKENALLKQKLEEAGQIDEPEEKQYLTRQEFEEKFEEIEKKTISETMLSQFLTQYPDYKEYEGKIRKFMNNPNYQNIPIGFIADGVVGRDFEKMGADKERQAAKEAEQTKIGGSVRRPIPGKKKGIWDMSKEEFADFQAEVMQKGRV